MVRMGGGSVSNSKGKRQINPVHKRVPTWQAARQLAAVPADTRPLTARLLGDPLPGRSALDRTGKQRPSC